MHHFNPMHRQGDRLRVVFLFGRDYSGSCAYPGEKLNDPPARPERRRSAPISAAFQNLMGPPQPFPQPTQNNTFEL